MSHSIWQPYHRLHHAMLSEPLADWLLDAGSFMKRLRQCDVKPIITVLSQRWQLPGYDEKQLLGISDRTYVLVREVLISSEETIWMFARSVFPQQTLTGKEKQLAHLKNRALGSILFKSTATKRGEFELTCLKPGVAWYEHINHHVALEAKTVWARRSLFSIKNKSLLLVEAFLPTALFEDKARI